MAPNPVPIPVVNASLIAPTTVKWTCWVGAAQPAGAQPPNPLWHRTTGALMQASWACASTPS